MSNKNLPSHCFAKESGISLADRIACLKTTGNGSGNDSLRKYLNFHWPLSICRPVNWARPLKFENPGFERNRQCDGPGWTIFNAREFRAGLGQYKPGPLFTYIYPFHSRWPPSKTGWAAEVRQVWNLERSISWLAKSYVCQWSQLKHPQDFQIRPLCYIGIQWMGPTWIETSK